MSKFTAFIFILALRILYQPSSAQKELAPFTTMSQLPESTSQIIPVKQISTDRTIGTDNLISANKNKETGSTINKLIYKN